MEPQSFISRTDLAAYGTGFRVGEASAQSRLPRCSSGGANPVLCPEMCVGRWIAEATPERTTTIAVDSRIAGRDPSEYARNGRIPDPQELLGSLEWTVSTTSGMAGFCEAITLTNSAPRTGSLI